VLSWAEPIPEIKTASGKQVEIQDGTNIEEQIGL
jgi:hypothetical protein